MSDETLNDSPEKVGMPLDLNSLSNLDFGPAWAGEAAHASSENRHKNYKVERRGGHEKKRSSGSRDRRPSRPSRDNKSSGKDGNRTGTRGADHRGRSREGNSRGPNRDQKRNVFEPTVKIDLYPQDEAFDALVKRLQSTARTYQLFEITKLLLEKYERFIVVVSPKTKEGAAPKLYYSVPGHLPFETEEAAINHVLANHLELFFEAETVEVEAPKGNFLMVNRCPLTQELLGPPNYHRYSEFLQRHFANRITGMSMDRYLEKIETVKDQEVIDAWVNSMKVSVRYTVKEPAEGEPTVLETLEAARLFLLQYRKAAVVGSGESVRFAGRDLERLPAGNLRRSVESYVEQQQYFPLETANNIRGRLRRHNFTIYKKGAKNASFVCAVKRKFRDTNSIFTESIQNLIDFIEGHPEIKAADLANSYLGIQMPEKQPDQLKLAEQDPAGKQDPPVDPGETEPGAQEEAKEVAPENAENPAKAETSPEEEDPNSESKVKPALTAAQESELKQLRMDLRWLVSEGYVTEYGDGRLFAPLPVPPANSKSKNDKVDEGGAANATEAPVPVAEAAPSTVTASTETVEDENPEPVSPQVTSEVEVSSAESPDTKSVELADDPQQSPEDPLESEEGGADRATNPKG